ncbi:MAG TPA: hypothetical protein VFV07_11010, partial [Rhizomicrobium sp.]|nr:hypothetical protein [Rhizomicrobium sp.]
LDALLQKAAESVYAKTQPYRYAIYLGEKNRQPESFAVLKDLAATAPAREQAWADLDWGMETFFDGKHWKEGHTLVETAVARDPDNADTFNTLATLDGALDREEAQLGAARRALRLFDRSRNDINAGPAETSKLLLGTEVGELTGDFRAALDLNARMAQRPDFGDSVATAVNDEIYDLGALHDVAGEDAQERKAAEFARGNAAHTIELDISEAQARFPLEDWRGVLSAWQTFDKARAVSEDAADFQVVTDRTLTAVHAMALAGVGDFVSAERTIRPTPGDCDTCLLVRARIAAAQRQWARADYWFAREAAQAPSLPGPDLAWGRALLAKGDVGGAVEKFKAAHAKGPRWADPLEYWGEALIAQNRSDLALAKFEEAAKYAPDWGRLHRQWGLALSYLGRKDEAQKQFALARSFDG